MQSAEVLAAASQTPAKTVDKFQLPHIPPAEPPVPSVEWPAPSPKPHGRLTLWSWACVGSGWPPLHLQDFICVRHISLLKGEDCGSPPDLRLAPRRVGERQGSEASWPALMPPRAWGESLSGGADGLATGPILWALGAWSSKGASSKVYTRLNQASPLSPVPGSRSVKSCGARRPLDWTGRDGGGFWGMEARNLCFW